MKRKPSKTRAARLDEPLQARLEAWVEPDHEALVNRLMRRYKAAKEAPWADPEPSIIHTLHVLLNPAGWGSEHLKWIQDGARAILENWHRSEDLEELKRDLGVAGNPKRRRNSTVRRETAIVRAIIAAAMDGRKDAKRVAAEKYGCDMRAMQRAWKNWSPTYLVGLESNAHHESPEDQQRIRTALQILKG